MLKEYYTITLTILDGKVAARVKEITTAKLPPYENLCLNEDKLDLQVLDLCRRLIENDRIRSRADFMLIGQLLYKILFNDKVRETFDLGRSVADPDSERRLRVELEFKGDDTLGLFKLPWEYLCYPEDQGDWKFVSTVAELVLTRYLQPRHKPQSIVDLDEKKINILLVVLNPQADGLGDLAAVGEEVNSQLDTLKQTLWQRHKIKVTVDRYTGDKAKGEKAVTWEIFKEIIGKPDCRPHILHLIAHGRFSEDKRDRSGDVAFPLYDGDDIEVGILGGNIDWVADRDFVNAFVTANKLPRFTFLHMCEGGVINKHDSLAGVALLLALEGVPAVLAMQHPIEIETSTIFSGAFYKSLEQGWTIDEAVQLSRAEIAEQNADNRAFGTPVLYLSRESGPILPKIPKPSRKPEPGLCVVIDIIKYQTFLLPVFVDYQKSAKLTSESMSPLEKRLRGLLDKTSADWISELKAVYQGYSALDIVEERLGQLCTDLKTKVMELELSKSS